VAKSIGGVRYVAVGEIVGLKEISALYNVSTTTAHNWTKRDENFPERVATVSGKPVWDGEEVRAWRRPPGG